jgi:hypothetical protein
VAMSGDGRRRRQRRLVEGTGQLPWVATLADWRRCRWQTEGLVVAIEDWSATSGNW